MRSTPQLAAAAAGIVVPGVKRQTSARGHSGLLSLGSHDGRAQESVGATVAGDGDVTRDALQLLLVCESRAEAMGEGIGNAVVGGADGNGGAASVAAASLSPRGARHNQQQRASSHELLSLTAFEAMVWRITTKAAEQIVAGNGKLVRPVDAESQSHRAALKARQETLCAEYCRSLAPAIVEFVVCNGPVTPSAQLVSALGRVVEAVRLHASHSLAVEHFARLAGLSVSMCSVIQHVAPTCYLTCATTPCCALQEHIVYAAADEEDDELHLDGKQSHTGLRSVFAGGEESEDADGDDSGWGRHLSMKPRQRYVYLAVLSEFARCGRARRWAQRPP